MSIAFSPQTHWVNFLSTSTVYILMCTMNIIYAICPEVIHPLISSHTSHAHPSHTPRTHPLTPSDLHTQLINTFTDAPPPTHTHRITTTTSLALCTKWLPWKRFFFLLLLLLLLLLLQKLTQSMHLDNKLDWVNQLSFQGIHFVFLLGLSLFILNIKYLKLS